MGLPWPGDHHRGAVQCGCEIIPFNQARDDIATSPRYWINLLQDCPQKLKIPYIARRYGEDF